MPKINEIITEIMSLQLRVLIETEISFLFKLVCAVLCIDDYEMSVFFHN